MIVVLLMAQAIVSSTGQTGGITTGSVGEVHQLGSWQGEVTRTLPSLLAPARTMACGGDVLNANIEVCIRDDGRRLIRLEFPPCGTPEAAKATHCLEWEIKKPAGPPFWHYKPVERQ